MEGKTISSVRVGVADTTFSYGFGEA